MSIGKGIGSLKQAFVDRAIGRKVSRTELDQFVDRKLDRHRGLAFGEIHGLYAFPLYVAERMKTFADKGVTRLYVEMIPSNRQELLDLWQDKNDASQLIDFINSRPYANATYQWHHYWLMFQAAKKAGIRVVAIDKRHVMGVHPNALMKERNESWMDSIIEDQNQCGYGEKFIVFGGQDHFRSSTKLQGISWRLGIPVFQMETGLYAIKTLSKMRREYQIKIPMAENQIAHFNSPDVPHRKISYPA